MAKKVYLTTKSGKAWRASLVPPKEGERSKVFESENGIAYDLQRSEEKGGGGEPTEISVIASRTFGPGHGSTNGMAVSTGTPTSYSRTLVNESGAPITRSQLGFIGFAIKSAVNPPNTPLAIPGNDTPLSAMTIEYPAGTTIGTFLKDGSGSFSMPSNSDLSKTDEVIHSAIPAGASYVVKYTASVPNGQNLLEQAGFVGHMTTALSTDLKKVRCFATGDSIMTQDARGVVLLAGAGKCPVLQMSIGGTRGFDYVAVVARLAKLAKDAGCTHSITNFGTNDWGAGQTEAQVATTLTALKNGYEAEGLAHFWCTTLPQSSITPVPIVSAVVDSAPEPTLTVTIDPASMTRFEASTFYNIAGFTGGTGLNGVFYFNKTSPTTLTAPVPAALAGITGSGPGTIGMIAFQYASTSFQIAPTPANALARYEMPTPATSARANINARGRSGEFGGCIEWADIVESDRNTNRWATRQNQPNTRYLDNVVISVASGLANANRFSFSPAQVANRFLGGRAVILTGAQRGQYRTASGNGTTDISLSSALPAVPAVGDTLVAASGSASPTADGVHPSLGGVTGGAQQALVDATATWIDQRLAA
jgi:hypothetical protein